ncbi:type II toxin-antitoxin system RelE/ParE family toxin [Candidatus Dependentiae bacterium]
MNVLQTPTFKKQVKKLHKNQKKDLDNAIKKIIEDPSIGSMKKGDLDGIQVYKLKMVNQLTLLAYEFYECEMQLTLLVLGAHENFYRDLKR